ncbi:tetratricopeptide repeat protein [Streptomyces diastatochromogenes]|uniref:tetratricopeptide repeat protein n=1 Tax=Streptomyces diastatochromogenes TaxID=42236 RepID=UPI0036D19F64
MALRQCFGVLDISVRGFAVTRHYQPSSVSRYLSGVTVAPDHFVARLVEAVERKLGVPMVGRIEDAQLLNRDTLNRARHVLGQEHPLALSCQLAIAADLRAASNRKEAGKLEEDALARLTRALGSEHPHTVSARRRTRPYWDFEAYLG